MSKGKKFKERLKEYLSNRFDILKNEYVHTDYEDALKWGAIGEIEETLEWIDRESTK